MRFLVRRSVQVLALLLALSMLTFAGAELAPGDFLAEMQLDPEISSETVDRLRIRYGLDQPLPIRYSRWLISVVEGELGFSFEHDQPVIDLVLPRMKNTLILAVTSTLLAWGLALVLGTRSALRQGGWLDRSTLMLTSALLALPEILLALLGLLVAAAIPSLPVGGMASIGSEDLGAFDRGIDLVRHLLIPVTVLVLAGLPTLVRHVRSAVVTAMDEPAVQAARSHGIEGPRLVWGYVLPSAANPLISLFGLLCGTLLSGSMLVEVVLGWPGLGPLMIGAVAARDLHVVLAVALISCLFLMLGNLLADLALRALDPRLRPS